MCADYGATAVERKSRRLPDSSKHIAHTPLVPRLLWERLGEGESKERVGVCRTL